MRGWREDPSLVLLVIANLGMILLAVFDNWNVMTVLWVYWAQSVIIGFFNALKLLTANVKGTGNAPGIGSLIPYPGFMGRAFLAGFFCLHYGVFHFVYAVFLTVFSIDFLPGGGANLSGVAAAGVVFFFNHLFSYYHNFITNNEREMGAVGLGKLFASPYKRIIPMHVTIMFAGAVFIMGLGGLPVLVFFLLAKTATDAIMHLEEHKKKKK